jgi:hypothetical protein
VRILGLGGPTPRFSVMVTHEFAAAMNFCRETNITKPFRITIGLVRNCSQRPGAQLGFLA